MNRKAYLAGPIANCTDRECNDWRESVTDLLCMINFGVLNPMRRDYRGRELEHINEIVLLDFLDDTQGLIWFYDDYGARSGLLGHDGSDPGTSSLMFFDPADGDGVLLVANGDWYDEDDDSAEADALFGALFGEAAE